MRFIVDTSIGRAPQPAETEITLHFLINWKMCSNLSLFHWERRHDDLYEKVLRSVECRGLQYVV